MEKLNRKSTFHFNVNTKESNFALSFEDFSSEVKKIDAYLLGDGMITMHINKAIDVDGEPDLDWYEQQKNKGYELADLMYKEFVSSDLFKHNEDRIKESYSIYDNVKEKENINFLIEQWMFKHVEKFDFIK